MLLFHHAGEAMRLRDTANPQMLSQGAGPLGFTPSHVGLQGSPCDAAQQRTVSVHTRMAITRLALRCDTQTTCTPAWLPPASGPLCLLAASLSCLSVNSNATIPEKPSQLKQPARLSTVTFLVALVPVCSHLVYQLAAPTACSHRLSCQPQVQETHSLCSPFFPGVGSC